MSDIIHTDPAPTLDEVWRLIRETDRQLKEQAQEADRRSQEADRRSQETDRQLKEQAQEAYRRSQETDRKFQEMLREISKLGNRLGDFVEGLVAPALVRVFQARGIAVNGLNRDMSRKNPQLNLATQIDLFVINGDSCVLVEVKSKLSVDDVNEHLERMAKFKPLFPEYADKKAHGAVAAMVIPDDVAKYAYRQGFWVIAQQGETIAILNDLNFKPMAW